MNITWKQTSKGEVSTPYKKETSPYKTFKTEITKEKVPVYVVQSPETRNVFITKNLNGKDFPGRLNLGMERAVDLCAATYTIASTKEFKSAINHRFIPEEESVSVMLLREPLAQSPFLNTYLGSGFQSRIYGVMDIHHTKDKKGFKGIGTSSCSWRLDIPKEKSDEIYKSIRLGILYDSIAGGRNIKAAIEEVYKTFPNLEKIVVVSSFASYIGSRRVAEFCTSKGIECEIFCMHEMLETNPENHYDCFYPHWNICKEDEKSLKTFYGKKYNRICIGGDFSANVFGTEQAKSVFVEQVEGLGINPTELDNGIIQNEK